MKYLLSIFFICFILFFNFYLYYTTNKKIEFYQKFPPFHLIDFTQSHLVSLNSNINYLLDKNIFTTWTKLKNNPSKFDFSLELSLSHFKKNEIYYGRSFENLTIYFCENIKLPLKVHIFLKEAIDMDKELRLPKEKIFLKHTIFYTNNLKVVIPLNLKFKNRKIYPNNIHIIGIRGKWLAESFNPSYKPCISEIKLN